MFSLIATVALSLALTTSPASPAQCDNMGDIFQCDKARAMEHVGVTSWERDFNVSYLTTRLDGVQPSLGPNMIALQDAEIPTMWHVYRTIYAPMLSV